MAGLGYPSKPPAYSSHEHLHASQPSATQHKIERSTVLCLLACLRRQGRGAGGGGSLKNCACFCAGKNRCVQRRYKPAVTAPSEVRTSLPTNQESFYLTVASCGALDAFDVKNCKCLWAEWLRGAHWPEEVIVTPEPCFGNSRSAWLGPKNLEPPVMHSVNSPPPASHHEFSPTQQRSQAYKNMLKAHKEDAKQYSP